MKRTNTFDVIPQSTEDEELLRRLLDASAALWNEITHERRENYADSDSDVWDISEYRGRYGGVLGASTVQQIERKSREAWRSFFALQKKGEANGQPGFWGNEREGRDLRTYIRNTSYSVECGEYSRLEILVGQDLKAEYGLGRRERLRLEVRGDPNWKEYDKQGRLELFYDEHAQTFRAFQPVTITTGSSGARRTSTTRTATRSNWSVSTRGTTQTRTSSPPTTASVPRPTQTAQNATRLTTRRRPSMVA
jgi:putative transposase